MALRTPRRRISPRARRRYRAIREFFRRAIGSTSQQDIKINSSIALNVTDLKHKIGGISNHIQDISRQCHLSCLQNNIGKEQDRWSEGEERPVKEQTEEFSDNKCHCTQVLFENRSNDCRKSRESVYQFSEPRRKSNEQQTSFVYYDDKKSKSKDTVKKTDSGLRRYNTHSNLGSFCSDYSTSSFHSLYQRRDGHERGDDRTGRRHRKKYARRPDLFEISFSEGSHRRHKHEKQKFDDFQPQYEEKLSRSRRRKKEDLKVDQQFIADIIKRQYKPVKLFGRLDSEISQFSAPVCRDQEREYSIGNHINTHEEWKQSGSPHLCTCNYEEGHRRPKYVRNNDLSDIRSICDTRMYSSKRQPRHRHRRKYADIYSDSTVYDMVPVREKSSPKSRRKFMQEHNMVAKDYYKEVPPSPKTHRPRLNLKAQYYEYEDVMQVNHPNRRYVMMKPGRHQEYIDTVDSETTSVALQRRMRRERKEFQRHLKEQSVARGVDVLNNLQFPTTVHDQANIQINDAVNTTINDTSLNKTQETETSVTDKADKALCEIKDILQNFLLEIKKEASSHNMKSELSANSQPEKSEKVKDINTITDNIPNHVPPCLNAPFPTPFTNPYCYPVMPMCPINYGGYALPSPSFSCHACFKNSACHCAKHTSTAENVDEPPQNATDELIKEIYKYVAKSPAIKLTKRGKGYNSSRREKRSSDDKMSTRSTGDSTATRRNNLPSTPRTRRRNAKIGTRTVKCYSKSCEAIGSRLMPDSVKTSTTLSDTVLDKLSLKVSESISDSDISSESVDLKKKKTGKFAKILQSLGLKKRNTYDDEDEDFDEEEDEEESEAEPTPEKKPKNPRRKHEPPFKQQLQTYTMYGQEYYHPPPVPSYSPRGPYGYHTPPLYDPRGSPYRMGHEMYTPHEVHRDTIHEHAASSHFRYDRPHPSAPPYPYEMPPQHASSHAPPRAPSHVPPHAQPHPQVPLCLKEVEVKSTGTQSERKLSFLRMLSKKPAQASPTQSVQQPPLRQPPKQKKPSWIETLTKNQTEGKTLKDILKGLNLDLEDPQSFQYKTQRQLAEGDRKMRNAMLKKIFHKRNPFSPNNLVMRTLLGKDPSSYGEPGVVLKNRLFIS